MGYENIFGAKWRLEDPNYGLRESLTVLCCGVLGRGETVKSWSVIGRDSY